MRRAFATVRPRFTGANGAAREEPGAKQNRAIVREGGAPAVEARGGRAEEARTRDFSTAMRALAVALLPYLRELLSAQRHEEDVVNVCAVVPGPKRMIMAACRRGEVPGAVRIGRRWLAPRRGVEAWLRSCGHRAGRSTSSDDDDLESVRRSLATPGRRRRTS
jgi:hypothetical protein